MASKIRLLKQLAPTHISAAATARSAFHSSACSKFPKDQSTSEVASTRKGQQDERHFDDSASALDYKLSHPHRRAPPLPTIDPPRWSAEEAVSNILYNTPPPSTQPFVRHTLNCLVQNEPGVLSRVSGTLAARGFNIESLVVCATEVKDLSRMSIVLRGQDTVIEQARRQLEDLVPVWAVLNFTHTRSVQRELLLVKISILGPDYFEEQLARRWNEATPTTTQDADQHQHLDKSSPAIRLAERAASAAASANPYANISDSETPQSADQDSTGLWEGSSTSNANEHHSSITASQALRQKHLHLANIETLARQFNGTIADVSNDCVVVELTGKTAKIDSFLRLVRPYGILEAARSGMMVMPRGWSSIADEYEDVDDMMKDAEVVDSSMLPPG